MVFVTPQQIQARHLLPHSPLPFTAYAWLDDFRATGLPEGFDITPAATATGLLELFDIALAATATCPPKCLILLWQSQSQAC